MDRKRLLRLNNAARRFNLPADAREMEEIKKGRAMTALPSDSDFPEKLSCMLFE